jgi:4-alpha-glucanotransferase
VEELAALMGIAPSYHDIWGNLHDTPLETKRTILKAMGIKDPAPVLGEMRLRPWNRLLEPVLVVQMGSLPASVPVHLPLSGEEEDKAVLEAVLEEEGGGGETLLIRGITPSETREIEGTRYARAEIPLAQPKDIGYHSLRVRVKTTSRELDGAMRLIVAPERCFVPDVHTWGISVNLYSVRSRANWGTGDLGDLKKLVRWAGKELGAGFVGINPLHATTNQPPSGISPYCPISRLYRNPIYIDMESVLRDYPGAREAAEGEEFRAELSALRNGDLIDYGRAAALKGRGLRAAFGDFLARHMETGSSEARDLMEYVKEEGRPLEDFATFMAIGDYLAAEVAGAWPEAYRDRDAPGVEAFRGEHRDEVLFHQFLQWLIHRQMEDVRREAAGMAIGILNDLAVGSAGEGSDAWGHPGLFARGVSAGAPPDAFSPEGQIWDFPPLIPERLRESGYELFIQTIRKNLRGARALRVDHSLGLFRLFWVPEGKAPVEGTYVRYPFEDLLGIIALESTRVGSAVIAEDLGTVGQEVREQLQRFGMLSYRLFYFERDWSTGAFLPPGAYPPLAISAATTHDLPTLSGFWGGRDIEVKRGLGLYHDKGDLNKDTAGRERDKEFMLSALEAALPGDVAENARKDPEMTPGLSLSVHRFLARTPSALVAASLDDIIFEKDQQNLPGMLAGYPNWQRKSGKGLEKILMSPHALELARMFKEEKRA